MKQRWIVVKPGSSDETKINLDKSFYQIGRSGEASIRIDNSRISGLHASILIKDDNVTIIDLDSTNGTRVNNKKIKQTELHDNDEIQLSEIKLIFREKIITSNIGKNPFETEISAMIQENIFSPQLYGIINKLIKDKYFQEDALVIKSELEQQERNISRLESLYSMLETTSSFLDRDTLIEALLLNITRILDLEVCGLYLLDTDSFFIIEDGRLKEESKTKTISKTILDKVLNQGTPLFLENIGSDSEILGFKSLTDFHIQSLLCLPIVNYYKNIIGAMYCVSKKSGQLNILDKDKLFLKATSTIISLSIAGIDKLNREKDFIKHEEKRKQEEKFLPVINNLRQKSEVLSLRYENDDGNILIGLDDSSGKTLSDFIRRAAKADLPVLLTGETGTGKSILSREIHRQGRPLSPFITVDCTTLPPDLIESELFGHEKGAFTGAVSKKIGRVAAAKNGTLFIDEIGDLPLLLQSKLLRLIQTGEYNPVGSIDTLRCGARLVFATNKNLKDEVRERRFREDLYFRLNVLQATIPPLRDRKEIILPMAEHFLKVYSLRMNSNVNGFSQKAKEALKNHFWPGNVRELENAVSRGLVNADRETIDIEDLELSEYSLSPSEKHDDPNAFESPQDGSFDLKAARERIDRIYISKVLALTGGNVSQAALKLNISRNSLMELIGKYKL